ncbi:MAG: TIGR02171 family protein [Fibrobacter sp.]|nr:TIGR02171 family protein [Fibrobacter sp.]
MKPFAFICFLVLGVITACSMDEGNGIDAETNVPIAEIDSLHEDFILVHSSGKTSFVGSDDSSAKVNERPQMGVTFSYDFSLERHETTCKEFKKLMQEEYKDFDSTISCKSSSAPITRVTYYDAILFANARSKTEGFDTVYTYTRLNLNKDKHCINLEGLNFHPEKKGYRLPTEAEWIFAASQGWNTNNSWHQDNASGLSHDICQKGQNDAGFCDLEGNVMEWVNDWLGNFKDTTITNFVGAPGGNEVGERVVKGGYFNSDPISINPHRRGDTYVVTGPDYTNYIGFRLAFGPIENGTWLSSNGHITSDKLTSTASSAQIKKLTGTFDAKLAFRNNISGNLVYLDYTSGSASFTEFMDTIPVYHPEISPDGRYVAFCTRPEGTPGNSEIYVKKLQKYDTPLMKLDVDSAAIPRWRILDDGSTVITYVNSANTNNGEDFLTTSSTWQVSFSKNKFGEPQKILDGAYHGGISDDNKIAVTGARLLRAKIATENDIFQSSASDTVWYNNEQACNVSLAKDGSKRVLFLDFAGKTGKKYVGNAYHVHERLFVTDSTGALIQSVKAPQGFTFDHTEWVQDNLVIATLSSISDNHEKIVLVNLSDSSTTELVEGTDLWHPSLWINPHSFTEDSTLNLDSAGVYMFANDSWASTIMRYKMELLWDYYDTLNVAILGSSRPFYALSPNRLSKKFFAVNFAHTPNSIYAIQDFAEKYILTHGHNLKYLVVSLDIDFWYHTNDDNSNNFFVSAAPNYPGYVYDANHDYWKDGVPEGLARATKKNLSIDNDFIYLNDRGRLLETICEGWGGDADVKVDSTIFDNDPSLLDNSKAALKDIIQKAKNRNIYVIGMVFPQNPAYKETGAFGRYGLRRSTAKKLIEELKSWSSDYPNFILMDENKMGNHDYSDDMASDQDHLCTDGSQKITARLDSLLKTLD